MPKAKKPVAPEFEKGQVVTFDLDGVETSGKIIKINGDEIDVKSDEGITYTCEPHELTKVEDTGEEEEEDEEVKPEKKKAPVKKAKAKETEGEEEEEEETPKKSVKKGKASRALTSAWNETEVATGGGGGFPTGSWEALVTDSEVEENEKGIQCYLELTGVNDEEINGTTQRKYYQLFDENDAALQGCGILKKDLIELGIDSDELEFEEGADIPDALGSLLRKIAKQQPWVAIKVVPAKKDGYTNIYINGLMPDQEEKPELEA